MSELMTEELTAEATEEAPERICPGHALDFPGGRETTFSYGSGASDGKEDEKLEEELDEELDGEPEEASERESEPFDEGAETDRFVDDYPRDESLADPDTVPAGPRDDVWPYGRNETSPELQPSSAISTKELGRRGENAAANYLIKKGYSILERNWTCKFGEADIIAIDEDGTVVFVEVKTRRTDDAGLPEEAITIEKQRRYEKLALTYMIEAEWNEDVNLRFDAIGISVTGDYQAMLKHHKGCFDGIY